MTLEVAGLKSTLRYEYDIEESPVIGNFFNKTADLAFACNAMSRAFFDKLMFPDTALDANTSFVG
ncbi:UNVERIFIED_CONTAM: hypothetical protein FOS07_31620, partial [Bacillus mycoides]